jgi:hypothetical protein
VRNARGKSDNRDVGAILGRAADRMARGTSTSLMTPAQPAKLGCALTLDDGLSAFEIGRFGLVVGSKCALSPSR